ncbi:MAG: DUF479 domain-containing protein [Gammaproteobacteria bacterium]|nr:DUF479 domain-containing protein [Gammaproteobacteria bacterium]
MNHLAHLVLAGPEEGWRLGAFLGDYVKGRAALETLPSAWATGIRLHRRVDTLCDGHAGLRRFLAGLEPPWRRYGGIILDVLFDSMLTRHWARFGPCDLQVFADDVDRLLTRHRSALPPRLRLFGEWARQRSLWTRYDDRAMLAEIFAGLARRHGRPSPLARGLALMDRHEAAIEGLFLELFPTLIERTGDWRAADQSSSASM